MAEGVEGVQIKDIVGRLRRLEDRLESLGLGKAPGKARRRRGRAGSWFRKLQEAGLWDEVVRRFEEGQSLRSIRAWLLEQGQNVSLGTLHGLRWKVLGQKIARDAIEELDRLEDLFDPLAQAVALLRRLWERYKVLIDIEQQVEWPNNKEALAILREVKEVIGLIAEIYQRSGVYQPREKVELSGGIEASVGLDPEEYERLVNSLVDFVRARADELSGDGGQGEVTTSGGSGRERA